MIDLDAAADPVVGGPSPGHCDDAVDVSASLSSLSHLQASLLSADSHTRAATPAENELLVEIESDVGPFDENEPLKTR